jgi:hypothetical protein
MACFAIVFSLSHKSDEEKTRAEEDAENLKKCRELKEAEARG